MDKCLCVPGPCGYYSGPALLHHMTRHFILVDPLHDYALRFLRVVTSHFGYQPLCIYTDRALQRAAKNEYPELRGAESLVVPREAKGGSVRAVWKPQARRRVAHCGRAC